MKLLTLLLGALSCSCSLGSPDEPGALVPPTADEDPALPQISIEVAGRQRALHLETFGDPSDPPLFAFHGGGGNDYRAMLPLRARRRLLPRDVGRARLRPLGADHEGGDLIESYVDEVAAVKAQFSPDRPIALAGYSWGGLHASLFAVAHPEDVSALVLIEPAPLSHAAEEELQPSSSASARPSSTSSCGRSTSSGRAITKRSIARPSPPLETPHATTGAIQMRPASTRCGAMASTPTCSPVSAW